jgi:hypothetical protein
LGRDGSIIGRLIVRGCAKGLALMNLKIVLIASPRIQRDMRR